MKELRLTIQQYMLLTALCLLLGQEGKEWLTCLVDQVEFTDVKYGHQN